MTTEINKLLVANRGEIAIRVLRAGSELNISTVSIYTHADRYSLHRYKADQSFQLGEDDDPLKPYLDIEGIIELAKECGADAIHPGYGFLSENPDFVRRCREEGITFVGPTPSMMEKVGDKIKAKELAKSVNVPLIPDSQVNSSNYSQVVKEAEHIGYPVMIKAAAGGGGRGMRVVHSESELKNELEEARSEAAKAFGNDTIFLEKFIDNPKHIEIQLLGDQHGNLVHLYERDCSVQRRFQKVVEIAPSQTLKDETLQKLYDYALQIGQAVDYSNAGTVEFLVDKEENIYFIEVNPRIQVEHTITEEITGIDIVRSQILVAMGYSIHDKMIDIPTQEHIRRQGFAIQCRVTTEDPSNDFQPDYGSIIAYRSPGGFGIRLDAGNAYEGSEIPPFFDSLLVKVTSKGITLADAADRLHRALREFRVRGVKTNIGFLLNLLRNKTFRNGEAKVNFIKDNPQLLEPPKWKNRGTKVLHYLADVIVNGNEDVSGHHKNRTFVDPIVPDSNGDDMPYGTRSLLKEKGRDALIQHIKDKQPILFTDTTFRDAHQSLLATRMRTIDMLKVADTFARRHGKDVFSMEVWGGATFDVALRFLKEDPWQRLQQLREAMPNVLLQMLLRGSNAVGYSAYPDNLIRKFVVKAWENGIDVFRIFDSLNWMEAMKVSIDTVINETDALAEVCMCYTGDIMDESREKFNLQYYLDMARRIEDSGAHILAIKDMAGLLKPLAAEKLITELKQSIDIPIHLHTHDTSSIQSTTYIKAIEAGVDIVDVAISSMSGLTSQPSYNALAATMEGHLRQNKIDLKSLNEFSYYWETVRTYYYPFETELRAGTAEVYHHEIPGGQYSNLRPQARSLGLEDKFHLIKKNYRAVNDLFGDIIKVTPSSKVVGDMAMFMTSNDLTIEDILEAGASLAFPESAKQLMRGDLGQIEGGFPKEIQQIILQNETPYTDRPNEHMEPVDFDTEFAHFKKEFGEDVTELDFLSYKLYDRVFEDFHASQQKFGDVSKIPTLPFFFGLKPNQEIAVKIAEGKTILVKYLNMTEPTEDGKRFVYFKLNGQTRAVEVLDKSLNREVKKNRKAESDNEIGAPLLGNLSQILVDVDEAVEEGQPLFIIEAMKMESTISSPQAGVVKNIHLDEKTFVEQGDLVVELSFEE
ncbi:MAG: pyruvate carboxylase [Balneolaceae bacterium]|nr:pyruvate carboxylase [Balneolaceae bacterium]